MVRNAAFLRGCLMFFVLCFAFGLYSGCASKPMEDPNDAKFEKGKDKTSYLWRVRSSNNVVYISGSFHLLTQWHYPIPKNIETAYDVSDVLAVEVNTLEHTQQQGQALLEKYGKYASGTIKDRIEDSTYQLLSSILPQYGLTLGMVEVFKPWAISSTLSSLEYQKQGYKSEFGLDIYFLQKANKDAKKIVSLETAESQIQALSSIGEKQQEADLLGTLKNIKEVKKSLEALYQLWKKGDREGINGQARQKLSEESRKKVFDLRDEKMVEKIEGFLKDSMTYFVLVGAGHLPGENGILSRLEKAGYTVEQL